MAGEGQDRSGLYCLHVIIMVAGFLDILAVHLNKIHIFPILDTLYGSGRYLLVSEHSLLNSSFLDIEAQILDNIYSQYMNVRYITWKKNNFIMPGLWAYPPITQILVTQSYAYIPVSL